MCQVCIHTPDVYTHTHTLSLLSSRADAIVGRMYHMMNLSTRVMEFTIDLSRVGPLPLYTNKKELSDIRHVLKKHI